MNLASSESSDMELNHLERPQGNGNDDDDSESDNECDLDDDGAEHALLSTNTQAHRQSKQPATCAGAATLWNQIGGIVIEVSVQCLRRPPLYLLTPRLQALPTLLFTIVGLLFTGEVFSKISVRRFVLRYRSFLHTTALECYDQYQ
jgi:hypothetical protein